MQLSNQDIQRLVNEGVAALQQRRFDDARDKLEQVTGTGVANAQLWLALATACRGQEDSNAEEAALDRMLELDPQSVRGHDHEGGLPRSGRTTTATPPASTRRRSASPPANPFRPRWFPSFSGPSR